MCSLYWSTCLASHPVRRLPDRLSIRLSAERADPTFIAKEAKARMQGRIILCLLGLLWVAPIIYSVWSDWDNVSPRLFLLVKTAAISIGAGTVSAFFLHKDGENSSNVVRYMHRETVIAKLTDIQQNVGQLLAQLQSSEHDRFAAHLYRSRREFRSACERAGKSGKQIERCVISFHVAESIGFKGDFRQWEGLLRIGD